MTTPALRPVLAVLTLAALMLVSGIGCQAPEPVTLRVLSYNIHHGEGMDGRIDLERLAGVIRRSEADLVALQEVDRGVQRTDGIDEPGRLGELTGMTAVFERNIYYQGGEYGNAVLSRLPVVHHHNHALPKSLPDEQRGLLEVHVRAGRRKLIFFATHFDYHPDPGERLASVAMLREVVEDPQRRDHPIIVAGDFNATPDNEVMSRATAFLNDTFPRGAAEPFTFPANAPDRRIDYILHNGVHLRCESGRVLDEPVASDHRPLVATFVVE